ncbi:hypothetical protein ACHWQZ_G007870 [Mnemiopsis leidyi]
MGKLFLEHPGGRRLYACASCMTVLTNKRSLVSTTFHGMSGSAYLFNSVVNVLRGDSRTTDMRTGRHIVRDVYCKRCQKYVGWTYEYAMSADQRYKEGMYVLECFYIMQLQSAVKD